LFPPQAINTTMKHMKSLYLIVFLFSLAYPAMIQAQQAADTNGIASETGEVLVELKSGSIVRGTINEWIIDEYLDLKTEWSQSMIFPSDKILKVTQVSALALTEVIDSYQYEETGIYYSGKAQLITGNSGPRARSVYGLGASASAGYKFSRLINVGAGVGYDRYIWESGENLMPIFLEMTSFFNAKNTSLYASCQAGYSLAFKDDDYLLLSAKGGPMVYPTLGIRFGRYQTKYSVDLGYKFQKAEFTYGQQWNTDTADQRVTYKRLSLRFGIWI